MILLDCANSASSTRQATNNNFTKTVVSHDRESKVVLKHSRQTQ